MTSLARSWGLRSSARYLARRVVRRIWHEIREKDAWRDSGWRWGYLVRKGAWPARSPSAGSRELSR